MNSGSEEVQLVAANEGRLVAQEETRTTGTRTREDTTDPRSPQSRRNDPTLVSWRLLKGPAGVTVPGVNESSQEWRCDTEPETKGSPVQQAP